MKWRTRYDAPKRRSPDAAAVTMIPPKIIPDKREKLKEKAEKTDGTDS